MTLLLFISLVLLAFSVPCMIAAVLGAIVGVWEGLDLFDIRYRSWKRRHKTAMAMRAEREAELIRRWEAAKAAQAAQQHPPA